MGKFKSTALSAGFRGKGNMVNVTDDSDPPPPASVDLIDAGPAEPVAPVPLDDVVESYDPPEIPELPDIVVDKPPVKRVKKKVARAVTVTAPERGHALIRRR